MRQHLSPVRQKNLTFASLGQTLNARPRLFSLLFIFLSLCSWPFWSQAALAQHDHGAMSGTRDHSTAAVYSTEGKVVELDPENSRFVVAHGPIPAVGWEAMTMGFKVADPVLLEGLVVGDEIVMDIRFEGRNYLVVDVFKD
ncbi:MAG: copper-binding protein [Deltaproteobacteria bacterium]|jgi:Cu/Ag efflux protein CusF|nr:copper-binding protein [Deltaproteobacteria bacterium]